MKLMNELVDAEPEIEAGSVPGEVLGRILNPLVLVARAIRSLSCGGTLGALGQ